METAHKIESDISVTRQHEMDTASESVVAPLTLSDAELYARFFQVLSDPTRIRLLHLLIEAPNEGRTVSSLVSAISAPQSRISTHLGCLRWCGLVQSYRDGKQVYYRIADARVRDLLVVGGAVMRDHAAGVASCGVIG